MLARILFVYAKLNPIIKYVQGMNEILAPIYFVFANDPSSDFSEYAEADSFYCFQNIMIHLKDIFIKTMDNSEKGI